MKEDLKIIKKYYGEKMKHFCRDNFSTIIDKEAGKLSEIMLSNFAPNKFLYNDMVKEEKLSDFKNYVYSFLEEDEEVEEDIDKTPIELLKEAGYTLYECKTEKDIQRFKKYYAKGEKLCTFSGGRLNRCHVFFAIKDNAKELIRKNFKNPKRQDEYGTSVVSIQFTRDFSHTLSIKNRYNHTVNNPDATFSNNLDNIIPGLTTSFSKYFGLKQNNIRSNFELSEYVRANDGKFYKYNYELNNIYYCPNNIIIDNFEVRKYEKEKYIVMDYFIIDLVNKKVLLYDKFLLDSFVENVSDIKNIEVLNIENDMKKITITSLNGEEMILIIDKFSTIVSYQNDHLENASSFYLEYVKNIREFKAINLKKVKNNFLSDSYFLEKLEVPQLESVGDKFLEKNRLLKDIRLDNLKTVGNYFLFSNIKFIELNFPSLETVGNNFVFENSIIDKIYMPKVENINYNFLFNNQRLKEIDMPNLKVIDDDFLVLNEQLEIFNAPKLEKVGNSFLPHNQKIKSLSLPSLTEVGYRFIGFNEILEEIYVPKLETIIGDFLRNNLSLKSLSLPCLKKTGSNFLYCNEILENLYVPELESISFNFLFNNKKLKELNCPKLIFNEDNYLNSNRKMY